MATITTNQTSYTNPNATLSVTATAQRISNSQITITANWTIYTAGSAQTSGSAYRYLVLCNSGGSALAYASMNRGTWASNTTYTGSCSFTVNASQGTTSMVIGFKVSASSSSISSSGTLIWNGNKSTNTGNPTMQTGTVTFNGSVTSPVITNTYAGDFNGTYFAVFMKGYNITSLSVAFWTLKGDQDDLKWSNAFSGSWTFNNITYNYAATCFLSDHNNEYGEYACHIYAGSTFMGAIPVYLTKTINFNSNGGSTPSPSSKSLDIGSTIGTLPTVSRIGYTFTGWYTETEGGIQITSSTPVTPDLLVQTITYYAHWQANTYTVSFNANGGSGAPDDIDITFGSSGTIPLTEPTRTHYNFGGWSTTSSGSAQYDPGDSISISSTNPQNITLYAVWSAKTYSISYNANGGSGAPSGFSYQYEESGTVTLSTVQPTRQGHTFLGWATYSTATSPSYQSGGQFPRNYGSSVTLYAVWQIHTYRVNFDANGGSVSLNYKDIQYGEQYGTLPVPTRLNYKFMGWYDQNGTQITETDVCYRSITLYAQWEKNLIGYFNGYTIRDIFIGNNKIKNIYKGDIKIL